MATYTPGMEISGGSLGQGLPIAVGMALGLRLQRSPAVVYNSMSDGELDEGSTWEAAMSAAHHGLGNLICMVDINNQQADGPSTQVMGFEPLADKWAAFGWHVQRVDGNHLPAVLRAFDTARSLTAMTDAVNSTSSNNVQWIAALPLTFGFFKDEAFFTAALGHGTATAALATLGAASTFAYILRFWGGIFLGAPKAPAAHGGPVPWLLVAPVAVLGALAVVGGVAIGPFADLASAAGGGSLGKDVHLSLAYHLDARPENLMALAAWGGGLLLWFLAARAGAILSALSALGKRIGPEHGYERLLGGLNVLSTRLHAFEVHDLRSRVATLLLPAGILVFLALVSTPNENAWRFGAVTQADIPILLVLLTASLVGVAACFPRDHLAVALLLSGVGYSLTVFYALNGAPDVALVAVLVETLFSLLFLGVLAALPGKLLRRARRQATEATVRRRDIGLAVISGVFAFFVAWGVLSRPAPLESAADGQALLTPAAHAKDVVTAVLADFRGLDTMGEISVIGIALLGLLTLLRRESAR